MAEVVPPHVLSTAHSIELDDFNSTNLDSVNGTSTQFSVQRADSSEATRRDETVALHPVDGGFHAWLFVFCAFMLECIVWGFPFRYSSPSSIGWSIR